MTQRRLERLCREWQEHLRLQDWEVTVRLVTHSVLPNNNGDLDHWLEAEQKATIRVRNDQFSELTLIHELLHIRLLPFDRDDHEAKELAINLLASCFHRLARKGKPK